MKSFSLFVLPNQHSHHHSVVMGDVKEEKGSKDEEEAIDKVEEASTELVNENDVLSYLEHAIDVWKITWPIILSEIFQNTLPVVDIAFVGQLSKDDLASAALATVWFNLWNATMMGFMTSIDTLLAQSYGANQHEKFAIWTGNSLLIVSGATIIVAGLVALCGPAMRLFGQDPQLADAAGAFSMRLIPGLLPYFMFKVLTRYLQTQNKLAPGVWIGIFANGMNAFFNWALIFGLDYGINGAPWATTLTRAVELILILLYMLSEKRKSLKTKWPIFSKTNLTRDALAPFWKLAISGALSISVEAWSFEITTILAGLLGVLSLDAHIITLTIATFLYFSFPLAIGISASIRVGQWIGEGRADDAKRSGYASFALSLAFSLTLSIILLPTRHILADLFSNDDEVALLVSKLIPISCLFMLGDASHATTGGILRGLGRQKLVFVLNILSFWLLQIPIGAILTFTTDIGVKGLWWGMNIGIYVSAALCIWFLKVHIDWQKETRKAIQRLSTIISVVQPDELANS